MRHVIRLLCLGLCLALVPCGAWAETGESAKKTSQKKSSGSRTEGKKASGSASGAGKGGKASSGKQGKDSKNAKGGGSKKSASVAGEGFAGLAWGAPVSALKGAELRETSGAMTYYTLPGAQQEVLGVAMREVVYAFCRGGFAGVLARYDGEVSHLVLQTRLGEVYGSPLHSPENAWGDRSWRYQAGAATVMMEYSPSGGTGALAWMAPEAVAPCRAGP